MTRKRRSPWFYAIAFVLFSILTYFVCSFVYVWWHISEAYAAWDSGTLVVRYMETHGGDWPGGWEDLEQLHGKEPHLRLRWNAHEPDYFDRLRTMVSIDWTFDTNARSPKTPVKSVDGTELVCLWSNPNEMVYRYLDRVQSDAGGSVTE